jgi:hypothetical protein
MIPLDTDHSGLNKFSGEDNVNFKRVLPEIRRMVKGGGSIVTECYRVNGRLVADCESALLYLSLLVSVLNLD